MLSILGLLVSVCLLACLYCQDTTLVADSVISNKEGYDKFLTDVVQKNYLQDNLSGVKNWKHSATYSESLAAIPQAKYNLLSKAQHREDLQLYNGYFKGKEKGLILESGAFDGFNLSSTLFFEKLADWSAIHIEADPVNFAKLSVNRPKSINVHMALCDSPRTLHYVDTGISLAHGIAEFMPDNFLKMHHGRLYRNKTLINDLREVPCFPIRYLFRHLRLRKIDVWVLDTEGSELAVLNGVDFSRMLIKVIILECDHHDPQLDARKQKHLIDRGYKCHQSGVTCFCEFKNNTNSAHAVWRNSKETPITKLKPNDNTIQLPIRRESDADNIAVGSAEVDQGVREPRVAVRRVGPGEVQNPSLRKKHANAKNNMRQKRNQQKQKLAVATDAANPITMR